MKKFLVILLTVMMPAVMSAQETTITGHKAFDNIYIGINAGATAPASGNNISRNMTPSLGLRIGKNYTTVIGAAFECDLYSMSNPKQRKEFTLDSKTFIDYAEAYLLGTVNMMNLFAGYNGEPRVFEVTALGGFGWWQPFGHEDISNGLNSKFALDLTVNLGSKKAVQLYLEPAIVCNLSGRTHGKYWDVPLAFDRNRADVQLRLGFNYKFKTSNGTHNFAIERLRSQAEIDALNSQINSIRADREKSIKDMEAQLNAANAKIEALSIALAECEKRPTQIIENKVVQTSNLQPTVVFGQGKSAVDNSQMANISLIATYMKNHPEAKVKICGYASPEGNPELNQILSEKRAQAVRDILVMKYGIPAHRLITEGLGATDKLFDEVEFNRIATFSDLNK